jgi:hypothetical protein
MTLPALIVPVRTVAGAVGVLDEAEPELELEPPPPQPLSWKKAKATMVAMPVRTNDRCMILPAALIIRLLVNGPSFCGQILLTITHNLDRASSLD